MAALEEHLATSIPLTHKTKSAIIESLRPRYPPASLNELENYDWTPYFNYYVNQCHHSLQGQGVIPRKHQDIVKIAAHLYKNATRQAIEELLRSALEKADKKGNDADAMDGVDVVGEKVGNTIDLVARLYLMVNISVSEVTFTTGRTKLQWIDGSPHEFLINLFESQKSLHDVSVKYEKSFTARNIERIAGITIQWTDNLADHLRMLDADDKTVAIFHYASFLKHHSGPVFPPFYPSLYPPGFIEETLRTLALLFPPHDKEIKSWLKAQSKGNNHIIDQHLLKCGHLRL